MTSYMDKMDLVTLELSTHFCCLFVPACPLNVFSLSHISSTLVLATNLAQATVNISLLLSLHWAVVSLYILPPWWSLVQVPLGNILEALSQGAPEGLHLWWFYRNPQWGLIARRMRTPKFVQLVSDRTGYLHSTFLHSNCTRLSLPDQPNITLY